MGGSSLAPEVITRTAGVELVVLDSTDADQVGAALEKMHEDIWGKRMIDFAPELEVRG